MHLPLMVIFGFQLVSDVVLILGAFKRNPFHVVPWLCANSVLMGILLVSHVKGLSGTEFVVGHF